MRRFYCRLLIEIFALATMYLVACWTIWARAEEVDLSSRWYRIADALEAPSFATFRPVDTLHHWLYPRENYVGWPWVIANGLLWGLLLTLLAEVLIYALTHLLRYHGRGSHRI